MDARSNLGDVIEHLTAKAKQTGSTTVDPTWLGEWTPRSQFEAAQLEWLGHFLQSDPAVAAQSLVTASRYRGYEGPLPQFHTLAVARDVYWQARMMFIIAGVPLTVAQVREFGADRALAVARLCLNGMGYNDAVMKNSARVA